MKKILVLFFVCSCGLNVSWGVLNKADYPPIGLVVGYNFEDASNRLKDVATPNLISNPSVNDAQMNLTISGTASVVFDADRNSYVFDPAPGGTHTGYAFTADTDKVDFADVATISCWVKPRNIQEQWKRLFGKQNGSCQQLNSMDSGLLCEINMASDSQGLNLSDGWNPLQIWRGRQWDPSYEYWDGTGPWHHLLVTWNRDYLMGYVDGVLRGVIRRPGWYIATFDISNWVIGGVSNSDGSTALLDDVAYFRGYCSATSAAGLYNGTYTIFNVPLQEFPQYAYIPDPNNPDAQPNNDRLMGWYHFENGSLVDTCAASYTPANGTLLNAATPNFVDDTTQQIEKRSYKAGWALKSADPNSNPGGAGNPGTAISNTDGTWVSTGTATKYNRDSMDDGFTLSGWVKLNDLHDDSEPTSTTKLNWGFLMNKGNPDSRPDLGWPTPGGAEGPYSVRVYQGGVSFIVNPQATDFTQLSPAGASTTFNVAVGSTVLFPGAWHHIAVTYKPAHPTGYVIGNSSTWGNYRLAKNEIGIYIDGALKATLENNVSWKGPLRKTAYKQGVPYDQDALPFHISDPFRPIRGLVDDVRIYDYALNMDEVGNLAFRTCPGDLTHDCVVDLDDFSKLANGWLTSYDMDDLSALVTNWLNAGVYFPAY